MARLSSADRALTSCRLDPIVRALSAVKTLSLSPASRTRLVVIIEEVQARLSLICAEMPTPLFNAMVERIALVQLCFEQDVNCAA